MGIIIRKKDTGEIFDTFPDFKLEIKNTSPVFNALGSKTVSTTLPKTVNNVRLFDYANHPEITRAPRLKMPVIVSEGSYVRNGILYLSSAYNTDRTFSITIAFNEGIMYENMSDIMLNGLPNLPVIEKPVAELIDDMNRYFTRDDTEDTLSVFQVYFKKQTFTETVDDEQVERDYREYTNRAKIDSDGAKLEIRDETIIIESNEAITIAVPRGYGITPFVRVWYLLDRIFAHYGYKVKENPFRDHFQLRRLCVLNNTIDAIVSGMLDYRQLLPSVSVNDFLQSLYCRFGMRVFFNSNTNEVSLKLLRDIFRRKDYRQLGLASFPDIDYTTPRQVRLSASHSLDQSETDTDTYEEFLAKHNNIIGTIRSLTLEHIDVGGVYYDPRAGLFWQISTINRSYKIISSIQFDWNKKDEGLETEEITGTDECLTMHHYGDSPNVYLYFGIDAALQNSILNVNDQQTDMNTGNVLAFAYDMGEIYLLENGEKLYQGYKYGSILPYTYQNPSLQEDRDGNVFEYALTFVGEYGAFNKFFKEYDAFLRHSNHTVKFSMHATSYELSDIEFDRKFLMGHQPVLLDKIDHDLDGKRTVIAAAEARTLRLYEPYDLDKEQELPVPDDIKYKWAQHESRQGTISWERTRIYTAFPHDNPLYKFISLSYGEILDDPKPPGTVTYWFLPPTEDQFQNETRVGTRIHPITVKYVLKYQYNNGSSAFPDWVDRSEDKIIEFTYGSWFEAEPIV